MKELVPLVETVESKIRQLLDDSFGVNEDDVTSNSLLMDDLGLDSLDHSELFIDVEGKFNLPETDPDVQDAVKTFQQLVAFVEKRRAQ